jgi:plastocyanin
VHDRATALPAPAAGATRTAVNGWGQMEVLPVRVSAWKPLAASAAAMLIGQGLLAAPVMAGGGPITIVADMPTAVPSGHNWSFNDFFPRGLSVAQGTTIQFAVEGFHTATLLPAGVTAAQDELTNGIAAGDAEDTGTNPNGTSHAQFNVPAMLPAPFGCGTPATPCTFDGSSVVSSGASFGPPPGPFAVTVTAAPGTYVFHCRIHSKMAGRLTVVPSGADASSASDISEAVAHRVRSDVRAGFAAERRATDVSKMSHDDGTTTWFVTAGTGSQDGHVAVLEFLPANIDIKPGDRVLWKPRSVNEPHTVTFPGELNTDLVPSCEAGATDTAATPLHFPPQGPLDFTCGSSPVEIEFGGGNGVTTVTSPTTIADSGIVTTSAFRRAVGLPRSAVLTSWSVSFAGAASGSYTYICQIHAGMEATVTVH